MVRPTNQPLRVAVLIDLPWETQAGGHVKAWERFALAACNHPDVLDVTLFFLGEASQQPLSQNVRYRMVPPALGTQRFAFLQQGGGHTDLAAYNRALAVELVDYDVFHITSIFAFARTAAQVAAKQTKPLVFSVHTDVPKFTRIYTQEVLTNLFGPSGLTHWLTQRLRVQELAARGHLRRTKTLLEQSQIALVSDPEHQALAQEVLPPERVRWLRRGIDLDLFAPDHRDRVWLQQQYGIAQDLPVALFAGRLDQTKNVITAAQALRLLLDQGRAIAGVFAGEGAAAPTIQDLLGEKAILTGSLDQAELAKVMASSDLFLFPSESETVGNVVLEAKASGLPVLLAAGGNSRRLLSAPGKEGILIPNQDPQAWAKAIQALLEDPNRRQQMGRTARRQVETDWPSWDQVLSEDLLPVWLEVAQRS